MDNDSVTGIFGRLEMGIFDGNKTASAVSQSY